MNLASYEGAVIDGRYRLTRFLDEGAFGAVFKAEQMAYGVTLREVALKIAKEPMSDLETRVAFHDALVMARLLDGIRDASMKDRFVTVHDAGRCPEGSMLAGHPYMVMELVRGAGLHRHLESGPFPLTKAIAYFDRMLEAVALMHRGTKDPDGGIRPVVHRDLKPANILVIRNSGGEDTIKIADFGLAIEVDTLLGWTDSGGTMAYLAPESFSRNTCSPQSDVYALGLIFYEMIAGKNPFVQVGNHLRGETDETSGELRRLHLIARQTEKFALLETHEELGRHPGLIQVLRTALASDMASRVYRNAGELKADWDRARARGQRSREPTPLDTVEKLLESAEQCYAVGDQSRGDEFLDRAMVVNRDPRRVSDRNTNGRCYLKKVERLLKQNRTEQAGILANEGYRRRPCRSTCLAVARYYEAMKSQVAANFYREASCCKDEA